MISITLFVMQQIKQHLLYHEKGSVVLGVCMPDLSKLEQFGWFDDPCKPEHYLTKTELNALGLKPAEPVAFIYWRKKRKTYYLYDRNTAKPKRGISEAQAAALAKAQEVLRTCTVCGVVCEQRIPRDQWLYGEDDTKRRVCYACYHAFHAEDRRIEVLWLRSLAQRALSRNWLILDFETTGLDDAEIMQIGIIDCAGNVLMNQLIKPRCDPTPGAIAVHGITMEKVADAPDLLDVLPQLAAIIHDRVVLVYNRAFDKAVLAGCLCDREIDSDEWLAKTKWLDLMVPYSDWYGDWSAYRHSYRWQRLGGTHEAVGDCLAALDCLKQMAAFSMYGGCGEDSIILPDSLILDPDRHGY